MAQFAERLQQLARGQSLPYADHPIVDATGIDGTWDFTVSFSGGRALQIGGRGGDVQSTGAPVAPDPSGGIPLNEALQEQLGLKLELRKHPMPVLVIDHAEPKPTDN
jgi:uncharacterized protein (TIGR03435 family)